MTGENTERKYKKNDIDVRSALWIAHGKRDFYSKELIKYREMVVDHIIPKEIFSKPEERSALLREVGKDEDFEMDSLENYVPTIVATNSSKKIELTR